MIFDKSDIKYLDEERKKLWLELRSTQNTTSDLVKITSKLKDEVDDYIKKIPEEIRLAKANVSLTTRYKNLTNSSKDESLKASEEIQRSHAQINQHLLEIEEKTTEINELFAKSMDEHEKIQEISRKAIDIEEHFENVDSIKLHVESLESLSESISEIKDKCNQNLSNVQKMQKDIKDFHNSIFGYTYTDEETGEIQRITGLKHELTSAYTELKENIQLTTKDVEEIINSTTERTSKFVQEGQDLINEQIKSWKQDHDDAMNQIRALMPQALTAGLSVAFSDKKQAELIEQTTLTTKFSNTIKWLSFISLLPASVSIYFISTMGMDIAVSKLPELVTAIIPVYIPTLWLAYSYNKRLNLSKRLVEEYTHKEVLSKTFEGLSHQIDSIDNSEISKELRIKLLYNLLNVSSENPGKLISDYNKTDHPILDVLEKSSKLTDAVESLSKIPGMSAVTKFMDRKSESLLTTLDKKVRDGLDSVTLPDEQLKPKEREGA
jgi:hypothetical protein